MKLRTVLSTLLAWLIVSSAFAAKLEKNWGLATTKNETGVIEKTIRYRSEMPTWVKKGSYKAVVVLSWPTSNKVGLPSKEEASVHEAFEIRTRAAEEAAKAGVLATVITGDGKVEWMYYAKTHEEFIKVLNKSRVGQAPVPIDIQLKQGALWTKHLVIGDGK